MIPPAKSAASHKYPSEKARTPRMRWLTPAVTAAIPRRRKDMRQQIAHPGLGLLALRQSVGDAHLPQGCLHVLIQRPEVLLAQALQIAQRPFVARPRVARPRRNTSYRKPFHRPGRCGSAADFGSRAQSLSQDLPTSSCFPKQASTNPDASSGCGQLRRHGQWPGWLLFSTSPRN